MHAGPPDLWTLDYGAKIVQVFIENNPHLSRRM